jgi:hypothetical protein
MGRVEVRDSVWSGPGVQVRGRARRGRRGAVELLLRVIRVTGDSLRQGAAVRRHPRHLQADRHWPRRARSQKTEEGENWPNLFAYHILHLLPYCYC